MHRINMITQPSVSKRLSDMYTYSNSNCKISKLEIKKELMRQKQKYLSKSRSVPRSGKNLTLENTSRQIDLQVSTKGRTRNTQVVYKDGDRHKDSSQKTKRSKKSRSQRRSSPQQVPEGAAFQEYTSQQIDLPLKPPRKLNHFRNHLLTQALSRRSDNSKGRSKADKLSKTQV